MSDLIVQSFLEPPLKNNNYVVIDPNTREAALIDCSHPDEEIVRYIQSQGATLKYIFLTHIHFDHMLGLNYFREKYQVGIFRPRVDEVLWEQMNEWMVTQGFPRSDLPEPAGLVHANSVFTLGKHSIRVIKTPGHTEESVCYLVENHLFSGDTLFQGTYGRTDLPGGSLKQIRESIHRLLKLPDETIVYPGHGPQTTIGQERGLYAGLAD